MTNFCFHFLKVASLVFLDIAQDCSLGQCLTSSRAEPPPQKKKNWGPNWGRNDLFYSNVVEPPLKTACFNLKWRNFFCFIMVEVYAHRNLFVHSLKFSYAFNTFQSYVSSTKVVEREYSPKMG